MLWNLSDGAFGVIPAGSGEELARHPIGSGPFRFVSAIQDREVVLERNPDYWQSAPSIARVRFNVVPDATTRALELRKGTADVAINAFPADTVMALMKEPTLEVERAPGTIYTYLALNLRDPVLRDVRVRQALACAIDRPTIIEFLLHGLARPASSVLPPESWAYDRAAPTYPHDPAHARRVLDEAGYKPGADGIRFHLVMKTSTDESARLLAAVLQQQFRDIGVALDIRSYEFATFYSDVTKGAFQMYSLRWIGGNEDPDIFESVFATASFAPKRANRSYYSNPEVDRLIADARATTDQKRRENDYISVQQIIGRELPYISLWYLDNTLVHSRRLTGVHPGSSGNYDFLRSAKITH
jgi:peptide/nickel transport system substrate-binding protein